MKSFDHLIGLPYQWGLNDCYSIGRRYYKDVFDLELADYIRPHDYWDSGIDLYMDNFRKEGFQLIDIPFHELLIGDAFLISIGATIATHAAVYVGGGKILHHFTGRLSTHEAYKGVWRNKTIATIRHPVVAERNKVEEVKVNLADLLPAHFKERVDAFQKIADASGGVERAVRLYPKGGEDSGGLEHPPAAPGSLPNRP